MVSEVRPKATTIASWVPRVEALTFVLGGAAAAVLLPFDRAHWWQWAKRIPVPVSVVAYLVVVAFASVWLLSRGCRLGVRFDDHGVTVRRLLKTYRYS